VEGDEAALQQLLLGAYDRLRARMERRLPPVLRGRFTAEDLVQETFLRAFRHIQHFRPDGPDSFYRWLATIAEHRMNDLIREQCAQKRGAGRQGLEDGPQDDSGVRLLEVIAEYTRTPSRSAAGHEAIAALWRAWTEIEPDYREALQLRYIEALPVAEVAARMGRTDRAIHMLCYRGLRQLRTLLGSTSQYFSSGA